MYRYGVYQRWSLIGNWKIKCFCLLTGSVTLGKLSLSLNFLIWIVSKLVHISSFWTGFQRPTLKGKEAADGLGCATYLRFLFEEKNQDWGILKVLSSSMVHNLKSNNQNNSHNNICYYNLLVYKAFWIYYVEINEDHRMRRSNIYLFRACCSKGSATITSVWQRHQGRQKSEKAL